MPWRSCGWESFCAGFVFAIIYAKIGQGLPLPPTQPCCDRLVPCCKSRK